MMWTGTKCYFFISDDIVEGRFKPRKSKRDREMDAIWGPRFAAARAKELMDLSPTLRAVRKAAEKAERKALAKYEAEYQAELDATECGTQLYHLLLDNPEILRIVLVNLDKRDLVCFSLASRECARLAHDLVPGNEEYWEFNTEERFELLMFLEEAEGWFGDLRWCSTCEFMAEWNEDLGDLCDSCVKELEGGDEEDDDDDEDDDEDEDDDDDDDDEDEDDDEDDDEEEEE